MKSIVATFGATVMLAIALLAAFALPLPTAYAAGGDLDPTFGGDGRVTTNFANTYDAIHDIAIQPDGKIVAVGTTFISSTNNNYGFSIARYNPDGSLDTAFGENGISIVDMLIGRDDALSVAIRPDGKIVAGGYCTTGVLITTALARFNSNGTLDTTFGVDNNGVECGGFINLLSGIALQPDGKIVASGYSLDTAATSFSVFRFNEDGTPDTSFDGDGRASAPLYGNINAANAIALQPDGKIVVVGQAHGFGSNYNFAAARYLSNGTLDTSFGSQGIYTLDVGVEDLANAVRLQPDGKIVVVGSFDFTGEYTFGIVRLLPDGTLDTSFNESGLEAINFVAGSTREAAYDVVVQSADGKIVVAGTAQTGGAGDNEFALARLLPDGSDDLTFGEDGRVTQSFGGGSAVAFALAAQSDGKLVAAGTDFLGTTNDFDYAIARYLANDPSVCAISFTDVPQGSTFYDYVACIACQGIIGGYQSGCETGNPCFRPNNNLTRGQLAKIVSNAAGFSENFVTATFEDVPVGSTFHLFVERLATRSIIGGYACGGPGEPCGTQNKPYLRPNANVTRGQTSKIIAIARNLPAPAPTQRTFEDVPITHTFWQWIEALYTAEAISGYACGGPGEPCGNTNLPYFRPSNPVTRGQSSKIVSKIFFPACGENRPMRK